MRANRQKPFLAPPSVCEKQSAKRNAWASDSDLSMNGYRGKPTAAFFVTLDVLTWNFVPPPFIFPHRRVPSMINKILLNLLGYGSLWQ